MRAQPGQVCERDALSLAKAAKEGMEQRQRADAKLRKEASSLQHEDASLHVPYSRSIYRMLILLSWSLYSVSGEVEG
jgi:hypothetical protein